MIKKVVEITRDIESDDEVLLDWFDMQKPNLCAISKNGLEFIVKAKYTHLHENGNRHQPVCIEDYKITILEDISTQDIIKACESIDKVEVKKHRGIFKPNGNAHHSH